MSEEEPTYPSAEELLKELGPERVDFMRSMMEPEYKKGFESTDQEDSPSKEK
jgi:hypothetical protein